MIICEQQLFDQQNLQRSVMSKKNSPYSPQPQKKQCQTPTLINKSYLDDRQVASCFETRLVNPEHDGGQSEQTFKKLLDINQNYLRDKVKISDVPKPSKYAHKVPSKTGSSQYNRKYASQGKPIALGESTPQINKTGNNIKLSNHNIVQYSSTYHKDYTGKKQEQGSANPQRPNKKYIKSQAPGFIESSYHRDYQSVAATPAQSAKRPEIKLMGGGKLNCDTTYKQCYRVNTIDANEVCQPIVHKDNKIFIQMANSQQSSYQQTFNTKQKKIRMQASCKPAHKYNPNPNKLKYKTQYNDVFVQQSISKKKQFDCLTKQQLKKYMMTILQD